MTLLSYNSRIDLNRRSTHELGFSYVTHNSEYYMDREEHLECANAAILQAQKLQASIVVLFNIGEEEHSAISFSERLFIDHRFAEGYELLEVIPSSRGRLGTGETDAVQSRLLEVISEARGAEGLTAIGEERCIYLVRPPYIDHGDQMVKKEVAFRDDLLAIIGSAKEINLDRGHVVVFDITVVELPNDNRGRKICQEIVNDFQCDDSIVMVMLPEPNFLSTDHVEGWAEQVARLCCVHTELPINPTNLKKSLSKNARPLLEKNPTFKDFQRDARDILLSALQASRTDTKNVFESF